MAKLRTFIVEDSSVIRENLTEALQENAPIDVVGSADDEASALGWLREHRDACDLVVIDIFLRAGNGLGVLKGLAGDPAPARVVLSNHATPEIRAKCAELGADKVFDKSNEIDEMLAWLNRLGSQAEAELAAR
ncbi:MAG: response regulator [Caldimonas sp.]